MPFDTHEARLLFADIQVLGDKLKQFLDRPSAAYAVAVRALTSARRSSIQPLPLEANSAKRTCWEQRPPSLTHARSAACVRGPAWPVTGSSVLSA